MKPHIPASALLVYLFWLFTEQPWRTTPPQSLPCLLLLTHRDGVCSHPPCPHYQIRYIPYTLTLQTPPHTRHQGVHSDQYGSVSRQDAEITTEQLSKAIPTDANWTTICEQLKTLPDVCTTTQTHSLFIRSRVYISK